MTFISVLIISLTCISISYFIMSYHRWQPNCKKKKSMNGPNTISFIKYAIHLLQVKHYGFFDVLFSVTEDFTSPCQYKLGNKLFIGIYEPDQIKAVLQSKHCLDKSEVYKVFTPIIGNGLLTVSEPMWTKKRKMFVPTFNRNKLLNYFDTFVEKALLFMDELENIRLNGKEVDLLHDILRYTVNITVVNLMGIKLELQSEFLSRWIKTTIRCREIFKRRTYNILLYPDIIFNRTTLGCELREERKIAHSLVDELIQQRMNVLKLDTTEAEDKTFLDILMEGRHEEYYEDIITMLAAASETTAITINFVLFVLANFPEIQEKVYEELLTIYGTETSKSMPVKHDDLQCMAYLERVIKETMRYFPPLPVIGRKLAENIKIGEYILPKGANVLLLITKLHRDEKHWPNPLVFDPDRFLPENMRDSYSKYIPFSAGPRNCIGFKYGMISMKVILATLIRTFIFKVDKTIKLDEIKFSQDVLIFTLEPLKVKIEKRDVQHNRV